MRPVTKGAPLGYQDGEPYPGARPGLVRRLGFYCSYCERHLPASLQVEHIRAKVKGGPDAWANFLLACVNCNPTKGARDLDYGAWLIPDRDNTARAFRYRMDGIIELQSLSAAERGLAEETLRLIDLNKELTLALDDAGNTIPLDRRKQRLEAWATAQRYRTLWEKNRLNVGFEEAILKIAVLQGFFSIWLEAFAGVPEMRKRFIDSFQGTETGCFDKVTTQPKAPHPNPDGLVSGGKL